MAKLTFHGHASFSLSDENHTLVFDPFITGNPKATITSDQLEADYILLTHGHVDHIADAFPIAQRCDATIIGSYELAKYFEKQGASVHDMGIGGGFDFPFGRVKLTHATHSSAFVSDDGTIQYLGNPCGIIVQFERKTFYNTGDTGLFGDMALIGRREQPDVVILPIGDNYTMGVDDAVEAVAMIGAKTVIPVHFNTFPIIEQDSSEFVEKVGELAHCIIMAPGESVQL